MDGSGEAAAAQLRPQARLGGLNLAAARLRAQAVLELGSRRQRLLLGFGESGVGMAAIYGGETACGARKSAERGGGGDGQGRRTPCRL